MRKKVKVAKEKKIKVKKFKTIKLAKEKKLPKLPTSLKLPKLGKKDEPNTNQSKQSNKPKRAISLQYKLIGSLVIFASLPVIIVSILSAQANTKAIENTVGSYSQSMIEQFGHSFDGIIDQTRNTVTQFMLMDGIQKSSLEPNDSDKYEISKRDMDINSELQILLNGNNMLNGIIVTNNIDRLYYKDRYNGIKDQIESVSTKDLFESEVVGNMRKESGPLWFNSYGENTNGIYLGWQYTTYYKDKEGILIASIDVKQVQDLIDVFSIEGVSELFITDGNKNIILAPDMENVGDVLEIDYADEVFGERKNGTFVHSGKLVSFYTFKNGWKAIYDAPLEILMKDVIKAKNTTMMVSIICILLALIIGFIIATSISGPINKLSKVMAEAATGNLGVEYTFNSDNEIGRLVKSFNQMISNIKALVLDTKMVAETIESNTETLQVVAESTATSSNQITQAIESIATGTESQTIQIVQSSQMMDNLSDNINVATQKVQDVQEVANNTMRVSNDTVSTMEELTSQSEKTIQISSEIERHIEELGNEASQITNVISMIQSISDQTNLLALNATIEAARAGEAGRGFGVVADEIRKLANQSKDATARIEQIIISIMKKKDTSIQGAREATNLIAMQRPIVDNTNQAFEKIHGEMEIVVTQLDELRNLFGEITRHKDDTVTAISEISDIIGHSASAAEEVFATSAEQSTSAESIADMSNMLLKGVEELKAAQQKFRL
ncbi:MAG TPA: methyl-accepting chemotaxis protein [Epulopiscium sp.]|nr:methyl-accepting chemotaxis protein [Candidatus Epulonipiscium sp.]